MNPSPTELRELATDLARTAGDLAFAGRRDHTSLDSATKSTPTDLVTEFDRTAERSIVDWLLVHRPDDAIVGEEGTNVDGTSGIAWLIDPIDGTTNFVYDQPAWACSIGVHQDGEAVAAAVFAPALNEMYTASRQGGASRNGVPISVSDATDITLALIGTGFAFDPERRVTQGARIAKILPEVRDIRRLGAASLDLCFVACGRLDAYFERHLNPWDCAAGELIAREAGALSSDFRGGPARPDELLVAAPGVHTAVLELLHA